MSLKDLLESGANVTVAVKLDDLREILKEAASNLFDKNHLPKNF